MAFMFLATATCVHAEGYITELIVLGVGKGGGTNLKNKYREKGYEVLDRDLNEAAGGDDVYIAYKRSSTADPETGYVTDIVAHGERLDQLEHDGRTYLRVPTNDSFSGDLNNKADGVDIFLYYTCERYGLTEYGGTKRVIKSLDPYGSKGESVIKWTNGSEMEANSGAGGPDISPTNGALACPTSPSPIRATSPSP